MPGSEPRFSLRNVATQRLLKNHVNGDTWQARVDGLAKSASHQDYQFKLECVEYKGASGKIPAATLIRTDQHPQSLLDGRDLHFQGTALSWSKCKDTNRWWDIHWIRNDDVAAVVAFRNRESGLFLLDPGVGDLPLTTQLGSFPEDPYAEEAIRRFLADKKEVQWELRVVGTSFTPGEVAKGVQDAMALGGKAASLVL